MEKQYSLFSANHAYVIEYYDLASASFFRVEDWDKREEKGLPPYIALAQERGNKMYLTTDVKAGSVYDECGYLMGGGGEIFTFEELEAVAALIGLKGSYNRRMLVCGVSSKGPQPCLLSSSCESKAFSRYSSYGIVSWKKIIERRIPEYYPEIMGRGICFYADVDPVVEEVEDDEEDERQLQFLMDDDDNAQ